MKWGYLPATICLRKLIGSQSMTTKGHASLAEVHRCLPQAIRATTLSEVVTMIGERVPVCDMTVAMIRHMQYILQIRECIYVPSGLIVY